MELCSHESMQSCVTSLSVNEELDKTGIECTLYETVRQFTTKTGKLTSHTKMECLYFLLSLMMMKGILNIASLRQITHKPVMTESQTFAPGVFLLTSFMLSLSLISCITLWFIILCRLEVIRGVFAVKLYAKTPLVHKTWLRGFCRCTYIGRTLFLIRTLNKYIYI